MPTLDYFLTTNIELTKDMISDGLPRELTPTLDLGKDNRTWNQNNQILVYTSVWFCWH